MKAIGYVRVSTLEQANEGISLENQTQKIRQYCQLNDLELTGIITDAGVSGKTTNRPGLIEVLHLVKTKKVQAVVVYKLDRLSRKVLDTLTMIEMFDKATVAFHSITEKIDTASAMGRFFLNITASLAQMERDLISERTADALQMKVKNHERAGQIPYGWTLAEDGNTLTPNALEQEAIVKIRELRAKGYTLQAVCNELTKEGYKPLGKVWYPQTIKNILRKAA
ncbi:MAG: recombinase family protein [Nitrospirae bacterium]|nr:recombinase family protein [Nitrospirota bacterium]